MKGLDAVGIVDVLGLAGGDLGRLELSVCEGFGHFGSVASALLLCAAALVALVGLLGGACR